MTARSSGWVQSFSRVVWLKTRPRTASPVPSAMTDWKTWIAKFARYWSSFSAPTRKNSPNSRSGRSGSRRGVAIGGLGRPFASATDGSIPPDREPPHDAHGNRADHDPQRLHREAADQLGLRQAADEGLDREAERPFERQDVGKVLGPLRHEAQGDEPARQEKLERDEQLEDRSDTGRPERDHPERPVVHRADQIRAPDREREEDDIDQARVQVWLEQQGQDERDRQP